MNTIQLVNPASGATVTLTATQCDALLPAIAHLMNDATREQIHADLSPCTSIEFINAYISAVGIDSASALLLTN